MKLNKKLNKGFTIVELVIVIAVVAILAAVLIPMFVNVTKKAQESVDTQLVTNLNTILSVSEATDGQNATMHDALADAYEGGYSVDKLTPTSAGDIVWNQDTDRFELIPENSEGNVNLWKIADTYDASEGYSVYLKDGYSGTSIDATTGVDVGNNTDIDINYTGSESVVIRTNGGELTVNNDSATVKHYGELSGSNIEAVDSNCYYEYGTVLGNVNLKKGTLVAESKSNISFINITAEDVSNIKIVISANASYGYVTAKTQDLLDQAKSQIETADGEIKSLIVSDDTVAILNGKPYSKNELSTAIANFKDTEGAVFELFTNIDNIFVNEDNAQLDINMPKNGTLIGHGYQISGKVAVRSNTFGGTITGVNFFASCNNAQRTPEQIERYGNANTGTLSSVYASGLTGKLTITDCIFDTADWEAIQITPKAGAEIIINNNIFKHPDSTWQQNRYIHVETRTDDGKNYAYNVDFKITVENNDFYNVSTGLKETAIEIYYPASQADINISGNYFDDIDITKSYTTATYQSSHISCIGYGRSYQNYCDAAFNNVATKPNNN